MKFGNDRLYQIYCFLLERKAPELMLNDFSEGSSTVMKFCPVLAWI
jgi:hypothetical protein